MKSSTFLILLYSLALIPFAGCKKNGPTPTRLENPFVTTLGAELINDITVRLTMKMTPGGKVTTYGFQVSLAGDPGIVDPDFYGVGVLHEGDQAFNPSGTYEYLESAWDPDTTYYVRAFILQDDQMFQGELITFHTPSRGKWRQLSNFPGEARFYAASFSANGKGYVCGGYGLTSLQALNDFWEYDPATDTWIQLPDYPGPAVSSGFSFVIDNNAYVGGGTSQSPGPQASFCSKQFYAFSFNTNTWARKSDISIGDNIQGIFATYHFSIGDYGYVGGGRFSANDANIAIFRYDPTTDHWEAYGTHPPRSGDYYYYQFHYGTAFVLGGKAYIGSGVTHTRYEVNTDFFSWDPATQNWEGLGSYAPIYTWGRYGTLGLAGGSSGFVGFGNSFNDIYQYFPARPRGPDQWRRTTDSPEHFGSEGPMAFSINNKLYIGLGKPLGFVSHLQQAVYEFSSAE